MFTSPPAAASAPAGELWQSPFIRWGLAALLHRSAAHPCLEFLRGRLETFLLGAVLCCAVQCHAMLCNAIKTAKFKQILTFTKHNQDINVECGTAFRSPTSVALQTETNLGLPGLSELVVTTGLERLARLNSFCRFMANELELESILPDDATKWVESFATDSFGDPLFALALYPLLSGSSPRAVQVWSAA